MRISEKLANRDPKRPSHMLIKGGRVIDPSQGLDAPMDVLLADGRISAIEFPGVLDDKVARVEVFPAKGLIVTPGFVDLHVHLREPGQSHKETTATGTAAAAAGGFTSVCTMPNTTPVNDSPDITRWMLAPERGAHVNVFPIAAATQGSNGLALTDYCALKDAGAVAVSDDGRPILHDEIMRKCLIAAKAQGMTVVQHAEDTRMTGGCTMNLSPTSFRLGLRGMPVEAESEIVERDIRLARETGGRYHVAHLSTRKALEAVRRAKKEGLPVTCEVTPHHILLLDEHVGEYNTNFKMNPPLRSETDREALLEGLSDGTIDAIATDHAPHASHEKQQEFDRAPMGITGLETALPIAIQVMHFHLKLSLARIVDLLSCRPAKVFGLKERGSLVKGAYADITLFDPAAKWHFQAVDSKSKSKNTPFDGWEFTGKNVCTIVGGKIVYQDLK
jgi:dihydroorotase